MTKRSRRGRYIKGNTLNVTATGCNTLNKQGGEKKMLGKAGLGTKVPVPGTTIELYTVIYVGLNVPK